MISRDPEFDAIDAKSIYVEARDRLRIAVEAESENRKEAKMALGFREGEAQWDHEVVTTASQEKIELTINLTDALVEKVINNIKQQRPRGKCHPVGDGADIDTADVINGLGRHVETRSEASVAYDGAADSATTAGWGYFRLIPEYLDGKSFQRELRILPIKNIFTVYMDPSAIMPTACDADWCLITIKMKKTEAKRRGIEIIPWNDIGSEERADWDDKEEIRLAEYFRIREKGEKLYQLSDGSTRFKSEMPDDESMAAMNLTIVDERDSSRRTVEWFRLNGTKVVEREQLPGEWIPVFRVEGKSVDIDGEVKRRGMVKSMMDPQRMVNYGEAAKIRRLGLAPKAPWVAAEGQLDGHDEWINSNRENYAVLEYKPVTVSTAQGDVLLPPPVRQPPAQIEAGFAEFVQGMRTNLFAVAGMPSEPGADTEGTVVSGKAIKRREKFSDQSHYHYYDNLTLAIAQCWRVMLQWFPVYYAEKGRIQRIIGEDSTPQMVRLNQSVEETPGVQKVRNDITVGRYDVVMDTGPGYETKREEGAENLIDLLGIMPLAELIAKVGPDLVFRSLDHPYMQELADRLMATTPEGLEKVLEGLPERARSLVQSMFKQIQSLQQQLQQTQLAQKYDLAGKHLQAVAKAHDTETMAATKRHDTDVRAFTEVFVKGMEHGHEAKENEKQAARDVHMADKAAAHDMTMADKEAANNDSNSTGQ